MIRHHMPARYFKEHGTLWTVALVRFPPIWHGEGHAFNVGLGTDTHNYERTASDRDWETDDES